MTNNRPFSPNEEANAILDAYIRSHNVGVDSRLRDVARKRLIDLIIRGLIAEQNEEPIKSKASK
jgi:hypothetical protein